MIIGITGRIGSGKTTAQDIICEKWPETYVLDLDKIGHEALKEAAIKNQLVSWFGTEVLTDTHDINRKVLGGIVFSNSENLKKLNGLSHPYIKNTVMTRLNQVNTQETLILIVGTLLKEIGVMALCDKIIHIEADTPNKQHAQLQNIAKHQRASDEFRQEADQTIVNNFDAHFQTQVIDAIILLTHDTR